MVDVMRERFDEQLTELGNELIEMGACCEEAIAAAEKLIDKYDEKLAQTAMELEIKIDSMERSIETLCTDMLIRQQPVAGDFKLISAAIHMISDMERIGDMARDISDISKLFPHGVIKSVNISEMASAARKMVTESVDSFVRRDSELAEKVIASDDTVDELFCKVQNEVIDAITADKSSGEACIDLIMIAKYFERIGDHASNIAERVIQAVE